MRAGRVSEPVIIMSLPSANEPIELAANAVGLKAERDRFIAFAFCAADMLLELDARRTVTYAGGATVALMGKRSHDFIGRSIFDLVPENEHPALNDLLNGARSGSRIEPSNVWVNGGGGRPLPMVVGGYYLADLGGRYFLALRLDGTGEPQGVSPPALGAAPEILSPDDFEAAGEARLREACKRGEAAVLTVLALEGLAALNKRLAASSREELMSAVAGMLRKHSLGGDTAGELGADRYGLLHDPALDLAQLKSALGDTARAADPASVGINVKSATIDIVSGGLAEGDTARAFLHAVRRIQMMEEEGLTFEKLSNELPREMKDTAQRIGDTRSVINTSAFDLAFQPIVDLADWRIHHFEVLVRLRGEESAPSPYQFIRFAEEVGMVRDFDLAMCRRVLEWLAGAVDGGRAYNLAMNLSGRSLSSVEFVAELVKLLRAHAWSKDYLMFELTESANITDLGRTDKIIQSLRRLGHKVCLDDFGAGEAAFHYLRFLEVDMVKIDGSYVRDALTNRKDRMFLKSIAGLCHDLKITTIAEMIEREQSVALVRRCGITFGQGYLFGRPSLDISSFDPARSLLSRAPVKRAL
jgi:EAL domain-containing protein (putative c-di-GMP-specific phosphodiesterase class I)